MRDHRGFTLVELVVTLSVAAILMTLATPALRDTITRNQLAAQTNEFVRALSIARSEAVKRGARVAVCKSSNGSTCTTSGGWQQGFIVFVDTNGDNQRATSPEETLLSVGTALSSGMTLIGNNNFVNFIAYEANGRSNNFGSFYLCRDSKIEEARVIVVNQVGRVSLATDGNGDGILEVLDSVTKTYKNITTCTP